MKTAKMLFFKFSLVLGLNLILTGCGPDKPEEVQNKQDSTKKDVAMMTTVVEDTLDLSKHPVDEGDAEIEFGACNDFVRVRKVLKVSREAEDIDTGAFRKLKTIANNSVPPGGQYVTGIKITYGLKPLVGKMDLLYTPIYMYKLRDSLAPVLNPKEKWGIYLVIDNPAYFTYNTTIDSFQVTSDYDCIEKYRSNIKIDHDGPGNGDYEDFNDVLDATGDVRSVIFSFQEIDSVIVKNLGTRSVKVFNASVKVPYNGSLIMKHSLLLGPDSKNPAAAPKVFYGGFNNKYANLGHLCPPGCSTVRFQLKYNP